MTNYPTPTITPPAVAPRPRVTPLAIVLLLVASLIGGVAIGAIVAVVSQWFYLIVLFTVLMGSLGGGILSLIIASTRMRNIAVAVVFGLLIGLITYGTLRYGQYLLFREQVKTELAKRSIASSQSDVDTLVNAVLQDEVGTDGFFGFVKYEAKQGIKITRGVSSTGITFKEAWAWIYWGVEILIVCGLATLMTCGTAARNYCENCQRWYAKEHSIGKVDEQGMSYFNGALQNGQFFQAAQVLRPQSASKRYMDVQVESCPTCNTNPSYMEVKLFSGNKKDSGKKVLKQTLTPDQYSQLQDGLRSRA